MLFRSDCRFDWRVASVVREDGQWLLESDKGEHLQTDFLVVTTPPEQVAELIQHKALQAALKPLKMRPCWALMLQLDRTLLADYDAAFVNHGPLSWLSGQSCRPGRPSAETWVLHASPDWSQSHLEDSQEKVTGLLLDAVRNLHGVQPFEVLDATAHRWRYALAAEPLEAGAFWFESEGLAVTGDWCHGSKVQGAFLAGISAAGRIMALEKAEKGSEPFSP